MMKRMFLVMLVMACIFALAGSIALAANNNFDGDSRDEVALFYSYPQSSSALWVFDSGTGTSFSPSPKWASALGGWNTGAARYVSDKFDSTKPAEIAAMYPYPNNSAALWLYSPSGGGFTRTAVWASALGAWDVNVMKLTSGDFDHDGSAEVMALYGYPNNCSALWLFDNVDGSCTAKPVWASAPGAWDFGQAKIAAGDFDGDGTAEVAALYSYPGDCAALWIFDNTGSSWVSKPVWSSTAGGWKVGSSKMLAGNFDTTSGDDELIILYEYPNACAALWMFDQVTPASFSAKPVWASAAGAWDVVNSKLTAGDYDDDGRSEPMVLYGYPGSCAALWMFDAGSGSLVYTPKAVWASAAGAWDTKCTKLTSTTTFDPRAQLLGGKMIDVDLTNQVLTCYETAIGEYDEGILNTAYTAVFQTLISSGKPGFDTPTGEFRVYAKDVVAPMEGTVSGEEYYIPDVPLVLWFYGGYSIHGAYWHNDFGHVRSHGCVNVSVDAAGVIFDWAPVGTPVNVHY